MGLLLTGFCTSQMARWLRDDWATNCNEYLFRFFCEPITSQDVLTSCSSLHRNRARGHIPIP